MRLTNPSNFINILVGRNDLGPALFVWDMWKLRFYMQGMETTGLYQWVSIAL